MLRRVFFVLFSACFFIHQRIDEQFNLKMLLAVAMRERCFSFICVPISASIVFIIQCTLCPTLTTQKNLNFCLEKHLFSFFSRVCVWTEKKKAKKDMLFFVNICTHTHTHIRRLCDIQIVVATSNELVRPSVRRFATQCYTMLHNGIELCAILQSLSISILRPLCVLSAFCHTAAIVITTTTCPFPVKVNQHVFASNLCAYAMVRACVCGPKFTDKIVVYDTELYAKRKREFIFNIHLLFECSANRMCTH